MSLLRMNQRILLITSIHSSVLQHQTRDMAHGFASLGWDVEVLRERWPGEGAIPAQHIVETALWFRPDIIFAVDFLRGQAPELWPLKASFVAWVQDALPRLLDPKVLEWHQPQDLILHSYAALGRKFTDVGYPAACVRHLKPGVNLDLFFEDGSPTDDFTVGFVANPGHPGHGDPAKRYQFYTEGVTWLMEAGVKVKTWGEGWQNEQLGSTWQGLVRNGPALRRAYSSVHANLHVNFDCDMSEHQRPYESLACGRPVLARCAPGGDMPHTHRFSDKASLLQAVEMVRVNAPNTCRYSVQDHSYEARAKQVIDMVGA